VTFDRVTKPALYAEAGIPGTGGLTSTGQKAMREPARTAKAMRSRRAAAFVGPHRGAVRADRPLEFS
jgi:hypothetical protein